MLGDHGHLWLNQPSFVGIHPSTRQLELQLELPRLPSLHPGQESSNPNLPALFWDLAGLTIGFQDMSFNC